MNNLQLIEGLCNQIEIVFAIIAFSHDFIIATETNQPKSNAVAIPSENHVLSWKFFLTNWAAHFRWIFLQPRSVHRHFLHSSSFTVKVM